MSVSCSSQPPTNGSEAALPLANKENPMSGRSDAFTIYHVVVIKSTRDLACHCEFECIAQYLSR